MGQMIENYAIVVFWSPEDRTWIADAPDLKSCSAFGETAEQAVAELKVAMEAWLDVAKAKGKPLPIPHFHTALHAAE